MSSARKISRRALFGTIATVPTMGLSTGILAATPDAEAAPSDVHFTALDRANHHLFMAAMALNELTADRKGSRWFAQFYGAPDWAGPVIEAFRFDARPDPEIAVLTIERRTRFFDLRPWACARAIPAGQPFRATSSAEGEKSDDISH